MDAMIHLGERRLGGDVGVVSRPAGDDGAECRDQVVLVGASMASDYGACPLQVAPLRRLAGPDEGLEAQPLSRAILPTAVGADAVLAYRKAQEVEAYLFVGGFEGMCDTGFTRFQLQADALEPGFCPGAEGLERLRVSVQNDHIVGIANDRGTPIEAMLAVG